MQNIFKFIFMLNLSTSVQTSCARLTRGEVASLSELLEQSELPFHDRPVSLVRLKFLGLFS